jgi:hypothetical protein
MSGTSRNHRHTRNAYKLTVRKPKELGLLGRVRCVWKDKIKICVEEGEQIN